MPGAIKIATMFTFVAAGISLSGCTPAPERQLIGTWRIDTGKSGFSLIDQVGVQLTFGEDEKFTISISGDVPILGDASRSGTWKFISQKENTLNVAYQWQPDDRPTVMTITIVDRDTIRLTPPLGPVKAEVAFKRVAVESG